MMEKERKRIYFGVQLVGGGEGAYDFYKEGERDRFSRDIDADPSFRQGLWLGRGSTKAGLIRRLE